MIKPAVSILIPHLAGPENDKALRICLDCLIANTSVVYELIIDTTRGGVYSFINRMARAASADWIVFLNSDVFMAPNWAQPMLDAAEPNKIVSGVIVECGAIGVNTANVHRNFGMRPETFQRAEFEQWVAESAVSLSGDGWYFPSLHNREAFLDMGGFDTTLGEFPVPLDIDYWNRWKQRGGSIQRVPSFCYHLQNYSNEEEQHKAVRGG